MWPRSNPYIADRRAERDLARQELRLQYVASQNRVSRIVWEADGAPLSKVRLLRIAHQRAIQCECEKQIATLRELDYEEFLLSRGEAQAPARRHLPYALPYTVFRKPAAIEPAAIESPFQSWRGFFPTGPEWQSEAARRAEARLYLFTTMALRHPWPRSASMPTTEDAANDS